MYCLRCHLPVLNLGPLPVYTPGVSEAGAEAWGTHLWNARPLRNWIIGLGILFHHQVFLFYWIISISKQTHCNISHFWKSHPSALYHLQFPLNFSASIHRKIRVDCPRWLPFLTFPFSFHSGFYFCHIPWKTPFTMLPHRMFSWVAVLAHPDGHGRGWSQPTSAKPSHLQVSLFWFTSGLSGLFFLVLDHSSSPLWSLAERCSSSRLRGPQASSVASLPPRWSHPAPFIHYDSPITILFLTFPFNPSFHIQLPVWYCHLVVSLRYQRPNSIFPSKSIPQVLLISVNRVTIYPVAKAKYCRISLDSFSLRFLCQIQSNGNAYGLWLQEVSRADPFSRLHTRTAHITAGTTPPLWPCPLLTVHSSHANMGTFNTATRIEEKRCEEAEKIPSISQRIPEATRS